MPERTPTHYPKVVAGTVLMSGSPNTGQCLVSFGGQKTVTIYSGVAPDTQIQKGAGRLIRAQFLPDPGTVAASGIVIRFYDANIPAVAGPVFLSGHKPLGVLQIANPDNGAAWASGAVLAQAQAAVFNVVYTSGLCVTQLSGQPGFTVSYTPVISGTF